MHATAHGRNPVSRLYAPVRHELGNTGYNQRCSSAARTRYLPWWDWLLSIFHGNAGIGRTKHCIIELCRSINIDFSLGLMPWRANGSAAISWHLFIIWLNMDCRKGKAQAFLCSRLGHITFCLRIHASARIFFRDENILYDPAYNFSHKVPSGHISNIPYKCIP